MEELLPIAIKVFLGLSGLIAGAVVALHKIAPLTKTKADDRVLTFLEKVEAVLTKVIVPAKYLPPKDGK